MLLYLLSTLPRFRRSSSLVFLFRRSLLRIVDPWTNWLLVPSSTWVDVLKFWSLRVRVKVWLEREGESSFKVEAVWRWSGWKGRWRNNRSSRFNLSCFRFLRRIDFRGGEVDLRPSRLAHLLLPTSFTKLSVLPNLLILSIIVICSLFTRPLPFVTIQKQLQLFSIFSFVLTWSNPTSTIKPISLSPELLSLVLKPVTDRLPDGNTTSVSVERRRSRSSLACSFVARFWLFSLFVSPNVLFTF